MPDLIGGEIPWLAALMMVAAALYAGVGHAGATAYIALMALFGLPPATIRPTALVLNVIVAGLATVGYARAGLFRWRTLWPFLAGSIPMAFVGGAMTLPASIYAPALGGVLLLAALRFLWPATLRANRDVRDPPLPLALVVGAGIGFLSGLTGIGGGIFLSPLLLLCAWSAPKPASGVTAAFILANSSAGLLGNLSATRHLPDELPWFAGAVLIGALVGTALGIRAAPPTVLRLLAVVLAIAGIRLIGMF